LLAFIREGFDQHVRTVDDVRRSTGVAAVSVLPRAATDQPLLQRGKVIFAGDGSKRPARNFLLENPDSPQAQALRGIRTSIMYGRSGSPPQALLVVSAFPEEGKTTVAVNLATALALYGSTCIVDADIRNPGVAEVFRVRPARDASIADVLAGGVPLDAALIKLGEINDLAVLPATPQPREPGEMICSRSAHKLIGDLRQRFGFLVLDAPPLLGYADAMALAPLVDGILFVSRAGVSTHEAVARSLQLLASVNSAPVLDVILNAADLPVYPYYHQRSRNA